MPGRLPRTAAHMRCMSSTKTKQRKQLFQKIVIVLITVVVSSSAILPAFIR